jgi:chemotaxis protein MotB
MRKQREEQVRIIVRKKSHGGEHHGGAWKVAFADFMTAMFALFLVLWLVNQSSDVKSAIAGYFQDPLGRASEHGSSVLPGEGAQSATVRVLTQEEVLDLRRNRLGHTAEQIQSQIQAIPDYASVQGNIEITLLEEGLRIELMEDSTGLFFKTGRSRPTDRGQAILSLLGAELGTLPFPVRIEGHTDAYPYPGRSSYTNWELSADRANAARRIMTANGLMPSQITEVIGYAARQPLDPADPYAPRNRRVTITMLLQFAAPPAGREPVATESDHGDRHG